MPIDPHERGKVGPRWHGSTGGKQTTLLLQKGKKQQQNRTETHRPAAAASMFCFFVFFEEDENSNKKIDIISNKLIPFKKYIFIPANGPPKTVLLWQNRLFQFLFCLFCVFVLRCQAD